MKRKRIRMETPEDELESQEIEEQTVNRNLRGRKRRPKRDGCLAGNPSTPRKGKAEARRGAPAAGASPGAASGLTGSSSTPRRSSRTSYGAVAIREIDKNAEIRPEDVRKTIRKDRSQLTYDEVVGKKAARHIDLNEAVEKDMVKGSEKS